MAGLARAERASLADILREVGPAAPTLCTGWTAHDLAAHLVTRERVPKAGPGLVVPQLHGITERAERAMMRAHTFPELVGMFRSGPPWWNPARIGFLDDAANLVEFFVHNEDVRRAAPELPVREPAPEVRHRLWSALRMVGRVGLRREAVGVVAERSDVPGRMVLHRGSPEVVLIGWPEDLLLYAYGRRQVARLELRGDADAIETLEKLPDSAPEIFDIFGKYTTDGR